MMNTKLVWSFAFALCTAASGFAQSAGNYALEKAAAGNYIYNNQGVVIPDKAIIPLTNPSTSAITLKAEVMMNVRATSYTAIFAVTQNGRDAYEVDSMMSGRINQVQYALGLLGIAQQDIHIDAVSMVPTYAFKIEDKKFNKRSIEIPTGFEMKKNIHILFKNHDILDRIISEMAFADIYDLVKIDYNIDGMQTYYEELKKAAMLVIQSKEKTYSDLQFYIEVTGMTDGFSVSYPMERYKSYTAYHSGTSPQAVTYERQYRDINLIQINGKNSDIHVGALADGRNQQFLVQTAEKNRTIFYDRMPYNQFDKVINADIEEPSIQFFYTLQLSYFMMTQKQHEKNVENESLLKEQSKAMENKRMRKPKRGINR
jgi:uncharacterized protein YggE